MPPAKPAYEFPWDYLPHNQGDKWRDGLPSRHRSTIFETSRPCSERGVAEVIDGSGIGFGLQTKS